ncbi:MAG TPA: hypothetical protein VIW23_01855 [Candidatus Acidoferrum sp.]
MANQPSAPQARRAILRALAIALVLGIAFANLDVTEARLAQFFFKAAMEAAAQLPTIIVTAWQALQPKAFPDDQTSLCAFQFLVFWPLIHTAVRIA